MRSTVLMISKPVVPPWNDSSKNLVKDLALAGTRFQYHVLTTPGQALAGADVQSEPIYRDAGTFSPPLLQNARVFARLLRQDDTAVAHFFLAPNRRATAAARLALALRARRTVQTVCSAPASFTDADRLLFADRVVVLSRHAERRFREAGVDPRRLRRIPPGIDMPPLPSRDQRREARLRHGIPADRPAVIYPGDYQFSRAAATFAAAVERLADLPATFVFACRVKQRASLAEEGLIRSRLAAAGLTPRVRMLREVSDMRSLLAACDLCVLPAETLYAKMDLPLVLLEALALGVPIVVADREPLVELLADDVGVGVPPCDPDALAAAVRALVTDPQRRERLAETARAAARDRYTIGAVSRQHEDLYQELLESSARGPSRDGGPDPRR